jgi:hypothetical protein
MSQISLCLVILVILALVFWCRGLILILSKKWPTLIIVNTWTGNSFKQKAQWARALTKKCSMLIRYLIWSCKQLLCQNPPKSKNNLGSMLKKLIWANNRHIWMRWGITPCRKSLTWATKTHLKLWKCYRDALEIWVQILFKNNRELMSW